MYVLGIWDGHDSGAALIDGDRIVYAANEERFTKRKLELKFPYNAVRAALAYEKISPKDVEHIAFTTTELTKTLERIFPQMKESYYSMRRRKGMKPMFENARHNLKYRMTSIGVLPSNNFVSKGVVSGQLRSMGFEDFKLHVVDHHTAHAATAAFTAPFDKQLVITLDGVGDGLSGSISLLEDKKLERQLAIKARDSVGIFYEQVTNIVGMRELEDEGKVMAMADYSYPFPYEENKLANFFSVVGTTINAKYSPTRQFEMLQRIAWQMPREQFAYMAQQVLENVLIKFASNAMDRYGIGDVSFAGGIFANVKANMRVRGLEQLKHWSVFPHMGDGGLALGAAMQVNYMLNGITHYPFTPYLGNEYSSEQTEEVLSKDRALVIESQNEHQQASHAAELIAEDNYVLWFQGRMEYGPRALGNRSILASPSSEYVKEKLNMYVKRREWYQPFAPSILQEDIGRILDYDGKGNDKFMTSAYLVRDEVRNASRSVVHVDGSARPQMVGNENPLYAELLRSMKKRTGYGMVLNTSFNIHGLPIVMAPEDALYMMKVTKTKYMFINGLFVTNRAGV
ncbi:MAG: hypothetical protein KGH66_01750 [Candidatus Micrarchaeota archaeon]|nr:hypothetical protein [Candidatus Micrarchaeota archaeon]